MDSFQQLAFQLNANRGSKPLSKDVAADTSFKAISQRCTPSDAAIITDMLTLINISEDEFVEECFDNLLDDYVACQATHSKSVQTGLIDSIISSLNAVTTKAVHPLHSKSIQLM